MGVHTKRQSDGSKPSIHKVPQRRVFCDCGKCNYICTSQEWIHMFPIGSNKRGWKKTKDGGKEKRKFDWREEITRCED